MYINKFKEVLWVIIGYGGVVIGSLVLVKILTSILSPAIFGQVALALTVVGFGQTIIYGGWNFTVARFFPQLSQGGKSKSFLTYCITVVVKLSVIWAIMLSIVAYMAYELGFTEASTAILTILPFSVSSGFFNMLNIIQNARRDRMGAAVFQSGEVWLRVVFVIFGLNVFEASAITVICSYTAASLVATLIAFVNLSKVLRPDTDQKHSMLDAKDQSMLLSYGWPFYVWGPFIWAQQSVDRWALGAFSGAAEIGIYAAVMQVSFAPIRILLTIFIRYITPIIFGRVSSLKTDSSRHASLKFVTKIGGATLLFTLFLFGVTLFGKGHIFNFLMGPDFSSGAIYLPWMILAAGIISTSNVLSLRLMGGNDVSHLIVPNIFPAVVGVTLSVVGAWAGGVWGVVAAQLFFGIFQLVLVSYKAWSFDRIVK